MNHDPTGTSFLRKQNSISVMSTGSCFVATVLVFIAGAIALRLARRGEGLHTKKLDVDAESFRLCGNHYEEPIFTVRIYSYCLNGLYAS